MHLALYLEAGTHLGGWRLPESSTSGTVDWPLYKKVAARAEAAKLDMIFIADKLSIDDSYGKHFASSVEYRLVTRPEPLTMLAALAAVTDHIGLGGTVSSSYATPYATARMLSNIDHISGGRAAWNLITSVSDGEARNFGRKKHYGHEERYNRAVEFAEVLGKLWDSWEEDAVVVDKERGIFADPSKFHYIDHEGEFFNVRGPINVPRPPQGRPVLIQAGVSDRFQGIASQQAEIVFVVYDDRERARAFYSSFKEKVVNGGRRPEAVKVLPGIVPIVGRTRKEALDKERELKSLIRAEAGLSFMSASMNFDLSQFEQDAPFPDITDRITGSVGRFTHVIKQAVLRGMTVGEVGKWYAESLSFFSPVGTPDEVAAQLVDWHEAGACDGFVVLPPYIRSDEDLFLEGVVPVLQERGHFRRDYPGSTLRDTLGLPVPANQYETGLDQEPVRRSA